MKAKETIEFLRFHPVFWSRLGFCYDPPMLNKNETPLVFSEHFDKYAKYHRDFTKAGVDVHTSILHNGWVGVNRYDYSLVDKVMEAVFYNNPNIWYIPRIKLNPPIDWAKENPEELFVYEGGPETSTEIQKLVGTLQQDILGYESPKGYYNADGWSDKRPNVGGMIALQSFSSKKWLRDAGEALRQLILYLENGKYGSRILAYHIAYGACGESMLWGRDSNRFGDYGIANKKAFFNWGMKTYHTLDNLRTAWNNPELDETHIIIPTSDKRENQKNSLKSFFRSSTNDKLVIDYDKFTSDVNAYAIKYFGKIVKENTEDKAVGVFYGYFMHITRAAYTGHLAIDNLLDSPYVDFFAAPKSYFRCLPGEPGGEMCPSMSINRKKLWVDESDNRTYLSSSAEKHFKSSSMPETRTVLWREFAKNLSHNSGFWWMDLGGGWYNDQKIMNEVSIITSLSHNLSLKMWSSVSEILLFVDENIFFYMNPSNTVRMDFIENFISEIKLCGAPVDVYRLSDMNTLDLSKYKFIAFLNAFQFSDGQWEKLKMRIPESATLLWNYAGGIRNPQFSMENVEHVTGFAIRQHKNMQQDLMVDYPHIEINEALDIKILKRFDDGGVMLAEKRNKDGSKSIMQTVPVLKAAELRTILKEAGCHIYAPLNCIVYADSRFIAVFSKNKVTGSLHLKEKEDLIEELSQSTFNNSQEIPLHMNEKEARFFLRV